MKVNAYTLRNNTELNDDIKEELYNGKYNYLHIKSYNTDFEKDLDILPDNIIGLTIFNSKKSNLLTIPKQIKYLHLYSNEKFIIIPHYVEELKVTSTYLKQHPTLLYTLPYNIKCIEVEIYDNITEDITYDFDMLPDSIERIIICSSEEYCYDIFIKLTKQYPNLNTFYISDEYNVTLIK